MSQPDVLAAAEEVLPDDLRFVGYRPGFLDKQVAGGRRGVNSPTGPIVHAAHPSPRPLPAGG
ncbi:hypothetical protein [Streptomyces sp. NPDC007856]|uniref:hypothetical protein n=1 Tax=Streptomyces sp. NPDC007856 TaxID=3364781 RepID=UPI0036A8E98F